jgi:hypothetical protein
VALVPNHLRKKVPNIPVAERAREIDEFLALPPSFRFVGPLWKIRASGAAGGPFSNHPRAQNPSLVSVA